MILTVDTDKKLITITEPVGICELYETSKHWEGYKVVSAQPKETKVVHNHFYPHSKPPQFGFIRPN